MVGGYYHSGNDTPLLIDPFTYQYTHGSIPPTHPYTFNGNVRYLGEYIEPNEIEHTTKHHITKSQKVLVIVQT